MKRKENEWKTAWMGEAMKLHVKNGNPAQTSRHPAQASIYSPWTSRTVSGTWSIRLVYSPHPKADAQAEQAHELLPKCTFFSLDYREPMVTSSAMDVLSDMR